MASTFTSNSSSAGWGGAIASYGQQNTFNNVTFTGNIAAAGSAINDGNSIKTTVTNCHFTNNFANGTDSTPGINGGTINSWPDGNLVIQGNYFLNNSSIQSGGAIVTGFSITNGNVLVQNNTFTNNKATVNGGAVASALTGSGTLSLLNNTLTNNYSGNLGGSIYDNSNIMLVIKNNTFTSNTTAHGQEYGKSIWLEDTEYSVNGISNTTNDKIWLNELINSNLSGQGSNNNLNSEIRIY